MNTVKAIYPTNGMRANDNADASFALPRPAYTVHIPGILVLVGLITYAMGTEESMALAAGTATAVALYMLWDWLFRLGPTRISQIFVINFTLGYGGGALNTYLTLPRAGSLAEFFGTTDPILARGMASILLISAALCFIGELYEKPLLPPNLRIPVNQKTCLFIYVITLGLLVAYATHSLGFSGFTQSSGGSQQQNPLVAVVAVCLTPIVTVGVAAFIAAPRGYMKWSIGLCALIDALLQTTVDRRAVFYMTMLTVFVLRTSGYRIKGNAVKNILIFGGLGAFAFLGISLFMLMRLAGYQHKDIISLPRRIEIISGWVADGSAFQRASEANGANVKRRSFVLGFYADLLEGSMNRTPGLGQATLSETVFSIPRALFPAKDSGYVFGVQMIGEEMLADELFGLTYSDAANSILTAGAVDFGIVGVIVFPLLMAFVIRKILDWTSRSLDSFSYVFMVATAVLLALPTESALFAYLSGLRNLVLLALILYGLQKLPRLAWKS
jgi:hypothetical protein